MILAIIAGFVFCKVSDIDATRASAATAGEDEITIEGHQYYWEFIYPNGTIAVDHLRLPYNRVVRLRIIGRRRQPQLVGPGARRQARRDPRQDEPP